MLSSVSAQSMPTTLLPSKTWRLDLDNNRISGTIDKIDAVSQAAVMALQTERYRHLIFSWQYGSELYKLIGKDKDYAFSEARRMITDALSVDSRITAVRDFNFADNAIAFVIDTVYGSKQLSTEVQTA